MAGTPEIRGIAVLIVDVESPIAGFAEGRRKQRPDSLGHDSDRDEVVLGNEFRPGVIVAGDYLIKTTLWQGPSMKTF